MACPSWNIALLVALGGITWEDLMSTLESGEQSPSGTLSGFVVFSVRTSSAQTVAFLHEDLKEV